jgi:hypothetical protein
MSKNDVISASKENFIKSEAASLGLPEEFIENAIYERNGKQLYFGQGYLALLSLIASNMGLGTLEFDEFKYRFFNLKYVLDKQETYQKYIMNSDPNPGEDTTGLNMTKLATQGQLQISRLNNYHAININNIDVPINCSEQLNELAKSTHSIFVPKDLPLIQGCRVEWTILINNLSGRRSESFYTVDYSKTKLGERHGAANYLPGTLVTRTKIAAYNHAFGNSAMYLFKMCKLRNHYDDDETETTDVTPKINTELRDRKSKQLSTVTMYKSQEPQEIFDEIKQLSR